MSNGENSSSYTADFRNIFGSDAHHDENAKNLEANSDRDGRQAMSVPPTSLLNPNPSSFDHIDGRNADSNITPSILLEQLAYVDNFMPSLEQDFANLDSWVMGDHDFGTVSAESGTLNGQTLPQHHTMGVDERLALELNAFADDSFIFPDEDKSQMGGHGNRDGEPGEEKDEADSNNNTNSHFLTQRRNTFLTSQYDHSKSRFSSRKRRKVNNQDDEATVSNRSSSNSSSNSPNQDHGGFSNFDIISNSGNNNVVVGNSLYTPSISSPLANLKASQILANSTSPTLSSSSNGAISTSNNNSNVHPQIQMPDYSTIPTATLVALLPKVVVPPGAYTSLLNQGLDPDQISAIAVIIAHHEQEKIKSNRNGGSNVLDSSSNPHVASRSASFLLDVLSRGPSHNISKIPNSRSADSNGDADGRRQSLTDREPVFLKNEIIASPKNDVTEMEKSAETPVEQEAVAPKVASEAKQSVSSEVTKPLVKKLNGSNPSTNIQTQKSHQKRKLKENELESSVHELSELAITLQQKIHTLEMENRLLKNLVTSSGELEGIEKAENIRKELLSKARGAKDPQDNDETK